MFTVLIFMLCVCIILVLCIDFYVVCTRNTCSLYWFFCCVYAPYLFTVLSFMLYVRVILVHCIDFYVVCMRNTSSPVKKLFVSSKENVCATHKEQRSVYICKWLTLKKYATTRSIAHIKIYNKHKHNRHYTCSLYCFLCCMYPQ